MIIKNTSPFLFGRKKKMLRVFLIRTMWWLNKVSINDISVLYDWTFNSFLRPKCIKMYHDTCKYIQFSPISKTNLCQIQNHVQICAVHMLLVLNWPPAVSLWFKYACKGPCAANMTCFCKKASWVSRLFACANAFPFTLLFF